MWILSDSSLRNLEKSGELEIIPRPEDKDYQPASIDLRIEGVFRQKKNLGVIDTKNIKSKNYWELFEEVEDRDGCYVLEPDKFYVIKSREKIRLSPDYFLTFQQRSGFGRRVLYGHSFGIGSLEGPFGIFQDKEPQNVEYCLSSPARTKIYKGGRALQLIVLENPSPKDEEYRPPLEVELHAGEIFELKDNVEIDTKGNFEVEEYFKKVDIEKFKPGKNYLVRTAEYFKFPNNVAGIIQRGLSTRMIEEFREDIPEEFRGEELLRNYIPLSASCFNAGFVDPGYEGYLTLQPFSRIFPISVKRTLGLLNIYPVKGKVERPYGTEGLDSEYRII